MFLISLTMLLLVLTGLALISPSVWQGLAMLLILCLMAVHCHNQPPVR